MTELDMMNKCYRCQHRGIIPGSAHSRCHHPKVQGIGNPMQEMMAVFASVGRSPPLTQEANPLHVQGDPHGIQSGWFNWPWNFDPVWLNRCDGYTPKEAQQE